MASKGVKRLPATEVKTHFGRIVQEVITTGTPIIIQTRGEDQAVIINLHDFQTLWPSEAGRACNRAAMGAHGPAQSQLAQRADCTRGR